MENRGLYSAQAIMALADDKFHNYLDPAYLYDIKFIYDRCPYD